MNQPQPETEPVPFNRAEDCKHPIRQLRSNEQEQLRGQRAKVKFTCGSCDAVFNGAEMCLGVLHYSYMVDLLRLERLIVKVAAKAQVPLD